MMNAIGESVKVFRVSMEMAQQREAALCQAIDQWKAMHPEFTGTEPQYCALHKELEIAQKRLVCAEKHLLRCVQLLVTAAQADSCASVAGNSFEDQVDDATGASAYDDRGGDNREEDQSATVDEQEAPENSIIQLSKMTWTVEEALQMSLDLTSLQVDRFYETKALHEFFKELGGFPKHYYLTDHGINLFEIMVGYLLRVIPGHEDVSSTVLQGSSGVGKSTLLVLVAMHMACRRNRKVVLIRRLLDENVLGGDPMAALICLIPSETEIECHFGEKTIDEIMDFRQMIVDDNVLVLLDHFNKEDLDAKWSRLRPFDLLTTSAAFEIRSGLAQFFALLHFPGWSVAAIKDFMLKHPSDGNTENKIFMESSKYLLSFGENNAGSKNHTIGEFLMEAPDRTKMGGDDLEELADYYRDDNSLVLMTDTEPFHAIDEEPAAKRVKSGL